MVNRIPPAGNPIYCWEPGPQPTLVNEGEQCLFVNSGTAALATSLALARDVANKPNPEVIMPGYACPDIISAAVHAGITPVLVDLDSERPYMSLKDIHAAINDNTVAITALNFLGIPERTLEIRNIIAGRDITLIEDSAQWYPDSTLPISSHFEGDLVVLSFGKGKPVSLLGGGALLVKNPRFSSHIRPVHPVSSGALDRIKLLATLCAYNCAISHFFYWLLEAMPFIELGATHFKILDTITGLDQSRLSLLSANIERYKNRGINAQKKLQAMLSAHSKQLIDLPAICSSYSGQRLLRYPILLPCATARDKLMTELVKAGTGASPFYPCPLPSIAGVNARVKCPSPLPNSTDFASRLITLPTHSGVTDKHIASLEKALQS
jgi:dTDP-4-amino-4,6-dideoxygalactose transaminase